MLFGMTATATDLTGLRTWISGTPAPQTIALLRALGALPLTRDEVLAEHPDDLVEGLEACAETLLGADALLYVGRPNCVELTLAEAAGIRILNLDETQGASPTHPTSQGLTLQ